MVVTSEFKVADPQASQYVFRLAPPSAQPPSGASYRVFRINLPWLDHAFSPGCTLRFPAFPGFADGIDHVVPNHASTVGSLASK